MKLFAASADCSEKRVVDFDNIPVMNENHHDLQTLKFIGSDKWIIFPTPVSEPLEILGTRFEAHVFKRSLSRNRQRRDEINNFGFVTQSPQQADSRRFGPRFTTELGYPNASRTVLDAVFFVVSAFLFLDKCYLAQIWLHLPAARTVNKISLPDIYLFPHDLFALRVCLF